MIANEEHTPSDGRRTVIVRCYAELNEYLPERWRWKDREVRLPPPVNVRSVIEALGIPEGEIDVVLCEGVSVALDAPVRDRERLSIYPVFESFDVAGLSQVRAAPLRAPRFILDVHLGKLAAFMRMMGYDAMYEPGFNDDELLSISQHERRALLSRDRRLIEHPRLTRAYYVTATEPKEQLMEVVTRFQLVGQARPFTRCLVCNTPLVSVPEAEAAREVPERVRDVFHDFLRCARCERIYWKGSHYERMLTFIDDVRRACAPRPQ